jgi:hypothetical protein
MELIHDILLAGGMIIWQNRYRSPRCTSNNERDKKTLAITPVLRRILLVIHSIPIHKNISVWRCLRHDRFRLPFAKCGWSVKSIIEIIFNPIQGRAVLSIFYPDVQPQPIINPFILVKIPNIPDPPTILALNGALFNSTCSFVRSNQQKDRLVGWWKLTGLQVRKNSSIYRG